MAPVLSKEAILQGDIDHLCLVCESYLRTECEAWQHVATAAHRRSLATADYLHSYRSDRVRKVMKWYFCEFCNVLVSTIRAVKLHVEEPKHKDNKSSQMIAREGDVIVSGNIVIQEDAWHGFVDDNTCIICNVEYDDKDIHKSNPTHVINLIQRNVVVDDGVYQKVDESSYHCLICNEVVTEIMVHLGGENHKKMLQDSVKETYSKSEGNEKTLKTCKVPEQNVNPNSKDDNETVSDILDSISKFQKNNIDINFESRTAVCKRCSVNLEFNSKDIESHIGEHKNNVQRKMTTQISSVRDTKNNTTDSRTLLSSPVSSTSEKDNKTSVDINPSGMKKQNNTDGSIQKMAEEYGLTYTDNRVYCQICNKDIALSIGKIIGHVNGELHKSMKNKTCKNNIKIEGKKTNVKKCNFTKVPLNTFLKEITTVKNMSNIDVVLNEKYCLDILNFLFFTPTSPGWVRCQVCEINVRLRDTDEHTDVEKHERAMQEVPLVIYKDSEFIREIRSEVFQCGYCNIYDTWEGIENHLKSSDHKESKAFASRRLSQHLPKIAQYEYQIEKRILSNFLMHVLFS